MPHREEPERMIARGQSKRMSLVESIANVAIGFGVAYYAQMVGMHMLGIPFTHKQNLIFATFMTVISIIRSFTLRRLFNWIHHDRKENSAQAAEDQSRR